MRVLCTFFGSALTEGEDGRDVQTVDTQKTGGVREKACAHARQNAQPPHNVVRWNRGYAAPSQSRAIGFAAPLLDCPWIASEGRALCFGQ